MVKKTCFFPVLRGPEARFRAFPNLRQKVAKWEAESTFPEIQEIGQKWRQNPPNWPDFRVLRPQNGHFGQKRPLRARLSGQTPPKRALFWGVKKTLWAPISGFGARKNAKNSTFQTRPRPGFFVFIPGPHSCTLKSAKNDRYGPVCGINTARDYAFFRASKNRLRAPIPKVRHMGGRNAIYENTKKSQLRAQFPWNSPPIWWQKNDFFLRFRGCL